MQSGLASSSRSIELLPVAARAFGTIASLLYHACRNAHLPLLRRSRLRARLNVFIYLCVRLPPLLLSRLRPYQGLVLEMLG